MCTVAVVLFGLVSFQRLPINLLPDLSYPSLTVETRLSGAAPVEVESLITRRIEEAVGILAGVQRISSRSRPGLSQVTLEFAWGRGREEAILLAGRDRLRPILMTALTTVLGLLPLALGRTGMGGWAYYYPLARTVMGGLISSTALTLIVLPYINYGVESLALWMGRTWRAGAPAATTPATRVV
jgi:multidrug efflux pump subunit AcrB